MTNPFQSIDGQLHCEKVPLREIAAKCGTPTYVYSAKAILDRYRAYDKALGGTPHRVCYAVKANSNLSILRLLANAGAGFDIVSGGELYRVLRAGGDPRKVVFSGVGKTRAEMVYALKTRIDSFNCESEAELEVLNEAALSLNMRARIAIRVNPDVDAATHPYISTGLRDHKFGIGIGRAPEVYAKAAQMQGLAPESVSCHIGSQLLDPAPLLEAITKLAEFVRGLRAQGIGIRQLDLGGGLGVAYNASQRTPDVKGYIKQALALLNDLEVAVTVEPGRSIVGEAGILLSQVIGTKGSGEKEFVIVDAAMNDLLRPALYKAHHEIVPVASPSSSERVTADVVGPVCESGDFLALDRSLPRLENGDLVAIMTAGAYGFVLSSNYNTRPRAAEVLVEGDRWRVVRRRESLDDVIRGEE